MSLSGIEIVDFDDHKSASSRHGDQDAKEKEPADIETEGQDSYPSHFNPTGAEAHYGEEASKQVPYVLTERPQRSVKPNPQNVQEYGPSRKNSYIKTSSDLSVFLNLAMEELDRSVSPSRADELLTELRDRHQDLIERIRALREFQLDSEYQSSHETLVERCNTIGDQLMSLLSPSDRSGGEVQDFTQRRALSVHSLKSTSSTGSKRLILKSDLAAMRVRQQARTELEQRQRAVLEMQRRIEEEDAQRKVQEAQEEAQRKVQEAEKTRKLNEMKDRLSRLKTENEQVMMNVELEAIQAAAAVLDEEYKDENHSSLSELPALNRVHDLYLGRTGGGLVPGADVVAADRSFNATSDSHPQGDKFQGIRQNSKSQDTRKETMLTSQQNPFPARKESPQHYNGTTYYGAPPPWNQDHAYDQRLSNQALPFVPAYANPSSDPHSAESQTLVKSLAEALTISRLPIPRPTVFKGDPLAYPAWIAAFQHLVRSDAVRPEDKMLILRDHVEGPAKEAVGDLYYELSETSYTRALDILKDRFGEDYTISESLKEKLESWPEIKSNDCTALTSFTDYLRQCQAMSKKIRGLSILDDPSYINRLVQKMPRPLMHTWSRKVEAMKRETRLYPSFQYFVDFLHFESSALKHVPLLGPKKPVMQDPAADKAGRSVGSFSTNLHSQEEGQCEAAAAEEKSNSNDSASQGQFRKPTCLFCKEMHFLSQCQKFASIPYRERKETAMKERLCFRCLRSTHRARDCKLTVTCQKCKGKHVTGMHDPDYNPNSKENNHAEQAQRASAYCTVGQERVETDVDAPRCLKTENSDEQHVAGRFYSLYIPVYVSARSHPEKEELVYAMLDTMSDTSFVLDTVAERLDLDKRDAVLTLSTLTTSKETVRCHALSDLRVRAYNAQDFIDVPTAYSQEELCVDKRHVPTCEVVKNIPHLSHLSEQFPPFLDVPIGLLLGVNVSEALRPLQIEYGDPGLPYAQRTRLGWGILGQMPANYNKEPDHAAQVFRIKQEKTAGSSLHNGSIGFRTKEATNEQLIKMMEQDFACPNEQPLSQEDHRFIKILTENTKVNDEGHYELPLPFKQDDPKLPNNRHVALRRLMNLKRRFQKDDHHFLLYKNFVQDMVKQGDAEIIPNDELQTDSCWYIPHHGVYNPNKPGKVRVVFDCAAQCQGTNINDHLLTGPDLLNSLIGVLCRFRLKPVAVTCDVERMFHQFHVTPRHRDYLRFLWWPDNDLNQEPKDYRMRVHLFGAASSPGCANFALRRLAQDNSHLNPQAAEFIQRDFYVDDGLHSNDNVSDAVDVLEGARQICKEGSLRLHKIASNEPKVLTSFPPSEVVQTVQVSKDLKTEGSAERALGVRWTLATDSLNFLNKPNNQPSTKRGVLSTVASIFDPLGLISPVVLRGRMILQEACKSGLDWDQALPVELAVKWSEWLRDVTALSTISIPRYYFPESVLPWRLVEFHHFADASTVGYGECSYLRIVDKQGRPHCAVVMAKSKVAPVRSVTVPRLELQAAVLSVKIARFLQREFAHLHALHHFWSDSRVVLGYLYNESKRFHTFVANRIQQILEFSKPQQWHHVASKENPADHASRGLSVAELKNSNWHSGPEFLKREPVAYEVPDVTVADDDTEVKAYQTKVKVEKHNDCEEIVRRFSSLNRLIRVVTRLLSWAKRARQRRMTRAAATPLSLTSQDLAFQQIVISIQEQHYPSGQRMTHPELRRLDAFTDHKGVLRVGGRIDHSSDTYEVKHPIILPKDSHMSLLLARHHHTKVAHMGRTTTMSSLLSSGIWICSARKVVSSVIHRCIHCARLRGRPSSQKMANLPSDRVEAAPPFTNTGLDCFGPFEVKDGRRNVKRYGLILTCLASRAVHLETLEDLSTDAFICGLRRFIAIRGNVKLIRCDRGTNFIGADRELRQAFKEMDKMKVDEAMLQRGCVFAFNPPSASHFGGVWERLIRTVRQVLAGLLCEHSEKLSTVTLATLLHEVAAIINNRPLCTQDLEDPTSLDPLTPNHLLTLKPEPVFPPPGEFKRQDLYSRKRWRRVQYLAEQFWARWRGEYIASLQRRRKWFHQKDVPKEDDVVLLMDEGTPRGSWKLARVKKVYPGHDGLVRSVQIQLGVTSKDRKGNLVVHHTSLDRPIHKLIPLSVCDK
ncbi:uncharacterized protein [Littorina saxatilis]|uniref:uncharacterized protein n=1 Tax=Littorina saxatilis TaxID=31220 RepID=UPI0038B49302